MLHGVNHDLGASIRDKRDELKTIAASATKFHAPRLPWTSRGRELNSQALQSVHKVIGNSWFVSTTALTRLIHRLPQRHTRLSGHPCTSRPGSMYWLDSR